MSARRTGDFTGSTELSREDYDRIVVQGDAQLLTKKAEVIGETLARQFQLTTAQIRNVFGTVRQIEMSWGPRATEAQRRQAARQLVLLKPKLAYQAQRERGKSKGVEQLANTLIPAIDLVGDSRERFGHFVDFFEAILAYHSAAGSSRGGRD